MKVGDKTSITYIRVSSDRQVDGTSLGSQKRICREVAETRGWTILEEFVEEGETAKTADRTQLTKALAFCRVHQVDYFVIYKVDRFARWQEDHHSLKAVLRQSGTTLVSATEPIGDTPEGRFVEGVLAASAQYDNEIRADRCKQGMQERVRQGVWVWPEPLGFFRPVQGGNIAPDPAVAPLIQLGFEEYSTGTYSFARLAGFLAARGLRSRHNLRPSPSLIRSILTNPIYSGVIRVWGQEFAGSFEPIVSKQLFAGCQNRTRKAAATPAPRSYNNPLFPLRGLVRCAECETTLTGSQPRGGSGGHYPYYHHYNRGCSRARYVPKNHLEGRFLDCLSELSINDEQAEAVREYISGAWKQTHEQRREQQAHIRKEITALEAERQRVFDLHRRGVYSDEDFKEQRLVLEEQINQKDLRLESADPDFELDYLLSKTLDLARNPAQTWVSFNKDYQARVQLQRLVLPRGADFDGEQLRTTTIGLIYQLERAFVSDKSGLVDLLTEHWNELLEELRGWMILGESPRSEPR